VPSPSSPVDVPAPASRRRPRVELEVPFVTGADLGEVPLPPSTPRGWPRPPPPPPPPATIRVWSSCHRPVAVDVVCPSSRRRPGAVQARRGSKSGPPADLGVRVFPLASPPRVSTAYWPRRRLVVVPSRPSRRSRSSPQANLGLPFLELPRVFCGHGPRSRGLRPCPLPARAPPAARPLAISVPSDSNRRAPRMAHRPSPPAWKTCCPPARHDCRPPSPLSHGAIRRRHARLPPRPAKEVLTTPQCI